MYHVFHNNIKQHNCFQHWLNNNVSWAIHKHIRMISERSCDTEDWSNDAEFYNIAVLLLFYKHQINAVLVSLRDLSKSFKNILPTLNFWMVVYTVYKLYC